MEFEEWVRSQLPSMLRLAAALSGSRQSADDLVQDVLVKAHARWPHLQSLDHPEAYLRRMLVNEHLSWRRRLASALRRDTSSRVGGSDRATPFDQQWVDRVELAAAVRKLPPRQRTVIVLRYLDDLTVAETARALGCAHSTVRAHTARALASLRVDLPSTPVPAPAPPPPPSLQDHPLKDHLLTDHPLTDHPLKDHHAH